MKQSKFKNQAKALRVLRLNTGFTQKTLAHDLGYETPQYISNIERVYCGVSLEMLAQLSKKGYKVKELKEAMILDYTIYIGNI